MEQCAYSILNRKTECCGTCEGFIDSCFQYTTLDHLEQFNEMFQDGEKEVKRLSDLEDFLGQR